MIQLAILCVFFFSGAASLVYELVWMRHLTLVFGATTYAISTILSIFMGGLALGSLAFGRWADRLARPLVAYAVIEVAIGLYALFVPQGFEALRAPYVALVRAELSHGWLTAGRALLATAVLLPPTVLMGGTLPILAAHLIRRHGDIARQTALLYFVNTAGAVTGCLISGFVLIETLGLRGATRLAALANGLLALAAIGIHLGSSGRAPMRAAMHSTSASVWETACRRWLSTNPCRRSTTWS